MLTKTNIFIAVLIGLTLLLKAGAAYCEPKNADELYYKNIIPGKTTADEAFKIAGKTEKTRKNDDNTVSHIYETKKAGYPNEITVKGEQVVHMAITIEDTGELNIKDVHKLLGEPKRKGYSFYAFTLRVSAYPEQGMVFIYEDNGGAVVEKQFFAKCTLEEFEKTFGKNFPEKYPYKM
ncbi:MAG: hypothetical protein BWY32_02145 [bacterium ADurb.Bin243]|nr:MAG: hypothetical protein BWY32_02145 [bacterium ADurb.Bin243]HOD40328.1 DUF4309 domain-containing protein [Candidatus Wallbacteria bacterium]